MLQYGNEKIEGIRGMCMYYKVCIHMHVRGLLLIYCSSPSSLVSHSIPYVHLWNHIRVNLVRKRYYPEKSWRNASIFSLQPNFLKAQLKK